MFDLDLRSRKPIYEQLVDKFKELIINDVMQTDEKLPSVRILAQQLTVNPNTIQKAYRELETQGYIYSVKGKGSFVDGTAKKVSSHEVNKIRSDLEKRLAEAFFIGITKDEIYKIIELTYEQIGGGDKDD
ncbi:HTH-type transcriptional repressor YtrA [Paraliobacillus sp. PM-2]|uniref:GntR family transcriptional regulator n=1 Tax=Paraliobacillus sp. PM-2 TaxID=1462524 RepID=UPI00061B9C63|nr:GntR family transcriptional regulator [Paraliobacillus sp. PM-2]CQR47879.1 HTH-type transcriptional repressor YtrA [Paraliobacillus sp. PM-2]